MGRNTEFTKRVDKKIGERIKKLRIGLGLSAQQVAEKLDVTHQQVQKYENGTNRISVGRLVSISRILMCPIEEFYKGIEDEVLEPITQHQRLCINIARNFMKIKDPNHQIAVRSLIHSLIN